MNENIKHKNIKHNAGMGSIRQRSKDSLTIIYSSRDGQRWETVKRGTREDGKPQSDADLRREAEARLVALRNKEANEGVRLAPARETLGQYLAKWLDDYALDNPGSRTPANYRYLMERYVIAHIGKIPLKRLTGEDIDSVYRSMIAAGLSGRTRHHVGAVLSFALKRAVAKGKIHRNVAADADKRLRRPNESKRYDIDVDMAQRLIARAAGTEIATLIPLLATTGMRIGEALGVRWSDIDLSKGTLHVRQVRKSRVPEQYLYGEPKTKRSQRVIPLGDSIVLALRSLHDEQRRHFIAEGLRPDHDLVFVRQDGTPMDYAHVRETWYRVLKAENVKARLHDWRHFAATAMIHGGIPLVDVSAFLGHANTAVTSTVYTHAVDDALRSGAQTLDRVLYPDRTESR